MIPEAEEICKEQDIRFERFHCRGKGHDDVRYQHIHMGINTVAFTDGSYGGFFDQREIKEYAEICLDKMVDKIWFGKG